MNTTLVTCTIDPVCGHGVDHLEGGEVDFGCDVVADVQRVNTRHRGTHVHQLPCRTTTGSVDHVQIGRSVTREMPPRRSQCLELFSRHGHLRRRSHLSGVSLNTGDGGLRNIHRANQLKNVNATTGTAAIDDVIRSQNAASTWVTRTVARSVNGEDVRTFAAIEVKKTAGAIALRQHHQFSAAAAVEGDVGSERHVGQVNFAEDGVRTVHNHVGHNVVDAKRQGDLGRQHVNGVNRGGAAVPCVKQCRGLHAVRCVCNRNIMRGAQHIRRQACNIAGCVKDRSSAADHPRRFRLNGIDVGCGDGRVRQDDVFVAEARRCAEASHRAVRVGGVGSIHFNY